MAASSFPTTQYFSENFVVSAGSVLFRQNSEGLHICLVHNLSKDEWMLPKGRKDCGERLEDAAVRETFEETGYACELFPVTMGTRAPPSGITTFTRDVVRVVEDATEPIAVTIRRIGPQNVKLIWWFVTRVVGEKQEGTQMEYENFESCFLPADEGVSKLTFKTDQDVAAKALGLVRGGGSETEQAHTSYS